MSEVEDYLQYIKGCLGNSRAHEKPTRRSEAPGPQLHEQNPENNDIQYTTPQRSIERYIRAHCQKF